MLNQLKKPLLIQTTKGKPLVGRTVFITRLQDHSLP
jgi:hypothetical protein